MAVMVAGGGGDVGAAALPEGTDGKVAKASRHAGQVSGEDEGAALGERGVADAVEPVLDLPVAVDPGRDPGAGCRAGWEAGDEVQPLDRDLVAGQVLSPAHDAQGLTAPGWSRCRNAAVFR